jgi:hypothetical protein
MNVNKIKETISSIYDKYINSVSNDSNIYTEEVDVLKAEWESLFTDKDAAYIILLMVIDDFLNDRYYFEDDEYVTVILRISKECKEMLKKEKYNVNSAICLLIMGLLLADY